MKFRTLTFTLIAMVIAFSCTNKTKTNTPTSKIFTDTVRYFEMQSIPGKLQCEAYDIGGEGITFHDSDTINSGSGNLNPLNGEYLHEFRKDEPVDISYTKDNDVDNNPFNFVEPELGSLYVGWTVPGEWISYTVNIKKAGNYQIGLMYTANADGAIAVTLNNNPITDTLHITSTYVEADTVAWRQWHHWNYNDSLGTINLPERIQHLTIHTLINGNMNYDYLNFKILN